MSAITTLGRALRRVLLQYLICVAVLWHRKTEPIPFLLLSTSLQQIPTVRALFLYKQTTQQHIKSLQSPEGQNRRKTHAPLPNKQKKNPKTNPHAFLLCFVISPFSVQCKRSMAAMFRICVGRGCAAQRWGHVPAPERVFNARGGTPSAVRDSLLHPRVTTETTLIALHLFACIG